MERKKKVCTDIKKEIIEVLKEASPEDVVIKEGEDDEPSSKDLNSTSKDSVAKIATKLSATDKEMKTVVNKWKKSEGAEKEEFLKRLKALTKIKKELEGLL